MGNNFNNGPTFSKLIFRVLINHIIIYRAGIKANLCPKHRPTISALIPSTGIVKIITASLMPRLNIIVKCLTLNSEFNFQSGQTSYIKII